MRISRIYIDQPLENERSVEITSDKAHYLKQVLRLSIDDRVTLFNGKGGEFSGVIRDIGKHQVTVMLQNFSPIDRTSRLKISLGLGIIKRESMDLALQKAAELGAAHIYPLITENTSVPHKALSKRRVHWQEVVYSACEQSGLNIPPLVHPSTSLPQWLNALNQPGSDTPPLKLVADLNVSESILGLSNNVGSLVLAIGPEGGFTTEEFSLMRDFQSISLGPRVLRAETAVITMMSLAQARWGDL